MRRIEAKQGTYMLLAFVIAAIATGCVDDPKVDDLPTWENYLANATTEFDGKPFYIIDGDVAVTREELRRIYGELVLQHANDRKGLGTQTANSTVSVVGWWIFSRDDIWPPDQARNLSYCVSDEFGELKGRAVAEMAEATRDWMNYGNFAFYYLPAHDSACADANPNVKFSVRPSAGDTCARFPSGGGCSSLFMNFSSWGRGSLGTFRHELGHVLGLQHENIRAPSEECRRDEGGGWRAVTPYDAASVMHYPCGATNDQSNLVITALDAFGVQSLYGPQTWIPTPLPSGQIARDHRIHPIIRDHR